MKKLQRFNDFNGKRPLNESLTINDAKAAIKELFIEHDGEVSDEYIRSLWNENSEMRDSLGGDNFDKAWAKLIDEEEISNKEGDTWCWCDMVQENVNESISKSDEEKYLTPKQRKLPEGLKKSIINRAKKAKKSKKDKE